MTQPHYAADEGSAATLTGVFAIYVLIVLATLLTLGSLSDHIGRRPLILAAIVVNVVAFVLFLVAHGPGLLYATRAPEGVAVGATANTLGAVPLDLRPRGASRRCCQATRPPVQIRRRSHRPHRP